MKNITKSINTMNKFVSPPPAVHSPAKCSPYFSPLFLDLTCCLPFPSLLALGGLAIPLGSRNFICLLSLFLPWSSGPLVLFCSPTNFSWVFHCLFLLSPSLHFIWPETWRPLVFAFLFILLLHRCHLISLEGSLPYWTQCKSEQIFLQNSQSRDFLT